MRMRNLLPSMALCVVLLFVATQCSEADARVHTIAPHTKPSTAKKVLRAVETHCTLPTNLVLGVIKVESDFKVDAVNKYSNDYGLMQINNWHVKRSKLDKARLLTDIGYNVKHGCRILRWFVNKYGTEEGVKRYNCGTRLQCTRWRSVKRYGNLVLKYKRKLDAVHGN